MTKLLAPLILAVALALLALGTAGLAYMFPDSVADILAQAGAAPRGDAPKKLKPEELDKKIETWTAPVLWTEPTTHHRLFDSAGYLFYPSLYPAGNYIQRDDGTARSPGGVLLSWYKKYGLDITSPTVDRDDPDNDGFSNIVEFKNEPVGQKIDASSIADFTKTTDPLDAQSHPDYLARLRLQQYESRPFHIRFNGYQELNGQYVFQIRLSDIASDRQPPLKKSGDPLGVEGYVIGEFHLNIVQEKDVHTGLIQPVDRSTLDIIKPDIDLHIALPFQQDIDSPESTADFVMLMPTETEKVLKVPRGKILTVPFLPVAKAQYLVIDVKPDGAKIRDTQTKQEYQIPKLNPADWDEVPRSAH